MMLQKLIDGKVDIKQSRSGQKQLIDYLYYKVIVDSDYKFNWLLSDIQKDEKEHRRFASSDREIYDLSILYTAKFFSIQYILKGLRDPDITFYARDIVKCQTDCEDFLIFRAPNSSLGIFLSHAQEKNNYFHQ